MTQIIILTIFNFIHQINYMVFFMVIIIILYRKLNHMGKVLFIKTYCIVDCTFSGGMVCCSPRHRSLAQGQSFPAIKNSKAAGGRLRPKLRTFDAWVVMPQRWGQTSEPGCQPRPTGLLTYALGPDMDSPYVGLGVLTQIAWVWTWTQPPTPLGPSTAQSHTP